MTKEELSQHVNWGWRRRLIDSGRDSLTQDRNIARYLTCLKAVELNSWNTKSLVDILRKDGVFHLNRLTLWGRWDEDMQILMQQRSMKLRSKVRSGCMGLALICFMLRDAKVKIGYTGGRAGVKGGRNEWTPFYGETWHTACEYWLWKQTACGKPGSPTY